MSQREPLFNFSEPTPVWTAGVLIALHLIYTLLPASLTELVRSYCLLAAWNGDVFIDRGGPSSIPSLLLHGALHSGWSHVLVNSGMIAVFGVLVCRVAGRGAQGSSRFLLVFLGSIVAGGLAQWLWWIATHSSGAAIGASGGGSGLFAAAAYVLGGRKQLIQWGLAWVIINMVIVLAENVGLSLLGGGGIAVPAHLGGYLGGALLALWLLPPNSTGFKITR